MCYKMEKENAFHPKITDVAFFPHTPSINIYLYERIWFWKLLISFCCHYDKVRQLRMMHVGSRLLPYRSLIAWDAQENALGA